MSVIIPCYNHARYLPRAVQSVQAQTVSDWEVIIIDDGSTDDTAVVARQSVDARVRYIYQTNGGLSAARNAGVAVAHGDYFVFLDADDELAPTFMQTCRAVLQADPSLAGVYTLSCFIDEQGTVLPQAGGEIVSRAAFRERNLQGGFFAVHAAMIRSGVMHAVGPFDTQLTSEEDWDLWIRVADRYENGLQGIAQPLARYRVYAGSMSTNALRMHTNRIAVLTKRFGPPQGEPHEWSADKRRAYGFAFRLTALSYLQQGQPTESLNFLTQAVDMWPALLERVDTFYEIIVGGQPSGYRGQTNAIDLARREGEVLSWLDRVCEADRVSIGLKRKAQSRAYLALGMLYDQAGQWRSARRALYRAVRADARMLTERSVMRRFIKLHLGRSLIEALPGRRGARQPSAPAGSP